MTLLQWIENTDQPEQLSLIDWIEAEEIAIKVESKLRKLANVDYWYYFSIFASEIGGLSSKENLHKYMQACTIFIEYTKIGQTSEEAWFNTCFDLNI